VCGHNVEMNKDVGQGIKTAHLFAELTLMLAIYMKLIKIILHMLVAGVLATCKQQFILNLEGFEIR